MLAAVAIPFSRLPPQQFDLRIQQRGERRDVAAPPRLEALARRIPPRRSALQLAFRQLEHHGPAGSERTRPARLPHGRIRRLLEPPAGHASIATAEPKEPPHPRKQAGTSTPGHGTRIALCLSGLAGRKIITIASLIGIGPLSRDHDGRRRSRRSTALDRRVRVALIVRGQAVRRDGGRNS